MSYEYGFGADNMDTTQNLPAAPPPVLPSPSDIMPITPGTQLIPMGPPKSFMEKLDEPGPLGWTWKTWVMGAAAVAAYKYLSKPSGSVTPNRRGKRGRRRRGRR